MSAYDTSVLGNSPVLYLASASTTDTGSGGHTVSTHNGPPSTTLPNGDAAYMFNGSTQYLEVANAVDLSVTNTGYLTVELWMRPDVLQFPNTEDTGYLHFIGKGTAYGSSGNQEWLGRMYNLTNAESRPNRISGYHFVPAGGFGVGSYWQDAVTVGQWIHFALVVSTHAASGSDPNGFSYDLGYTKIYKNGVLRDQDALDNPGLTVIIPVHGSAPVRIATEDFASFFQGAIGKIAIYNTELTAAQLTANYNAMSVVPPPPPPPPVITYTDVMTGAIGATGIESDTEIVGTPGGFSDVESGTVGVQGIEVDTLAIGGTNYTDNLQGVINDGGIETDTFTTGITPPPPNTAPSIVVQPANLTVSNNTTATFNSLATGNPTPTAQWQVSTNSGTTWSNVLGATSSSYAFVAVLAQSGQRYRVIYTNSAGTATSTAAILTVTTGPPPPPPPPPPRPKVYNYNVVRMIREYPSTRLSCSIQTPSGKIFRWAPDEHDGQNVPMGLRQSTSAPGGFESLDVSLPRDPQRDYADLEVLSTIRTYGAGGEIAGEYRLEGIPATSGSQMSISPSAVGWQSHLSDNENCSVIFIDRDMSKWGTTSLERQKYMAQQNYSPSQGAGINPGVTPELQFEISDIQEASPATSTQPAPLVEAYYDAGGSSIGQLRSNYQSHNCAPGSPGSGWNLFWEIVNPTLDPTFANTSSYQRAYLPLLNDTGTTMRSVVQTAAPLTSSVSIPISTPGRWNGALLSLTYIGAYSMPTNQQLVWDTWMQNLRVIGNHGLTIQAPAGAVDPLAQEGVLASDALLYIIRNFAPMLNASKATISPSTFVIPQLRFDQTTPGEMINGTIAFGMPSPDWFCWENRTFWVHPRGTHNRNWRARIGPAQLSETGPALNQLWNAVTVTYTDTAGTTRVVGPRGSGATIIDDLLKDPDPANPLNQAGILRQHNLALGVTSTPAVASQVGQAFLAEAKLISRAGQAIHVGVIEDAYKGMLYPTWMIRAGDTIRYLDSSDPSPRRVVHTDYDNDTRTCTVQLDSPPDSLPGLLARLGAGITSVGIG